MDMYYFSNTYRTVLARSLCIILFSTWRYCVHTCTRSGSSSSSVLRVNHVSLFLLITTSYVIYINEKYIVLFGAMYSKIVFNACDSLYVGHISSTLATKN